MGDASDVLARMTDAAIGTIFIVTGAITAGASIAVIAPVAVLRIIFGTVEPDALTVTLARHWALLVGVVGCLLIYAGYHPEARPPIVIGAIVEKLGIGVIVFTSPWRRRVAAAIVAGADTAMGLLYLAILVVGRAF